MPQKVLRVGRWELEHHILKPSRCHLQTHAVRINKALQNPADLVTFICTSHPPTPHPPPDADAAGRITVHRVLLDAAGSPLRSLVSGAFKEANTKEITIHERYDCFEVVRKFLHCEPINMDKVPVELPLVADRWGLTTLFRACFRHAEECAHAHKATPRLHIGELVTRFLPIMSIVEVPSTFKTHMAMRIGIEMRQLNQYFKDNPVQIAPLCREAVCSLRHAEGVQCRRKKSTALIDDIAQTVDGKNSSTPVQPNPSASEQSIEPNNQSDDARSGHNTSGQTAPGNLSLCSNSDPLEKPSKNAAETESSAKDVHARFEKASERELTQSSSGIPTSPARVPANHSKVATENKYPPESNASSTEISSSAIKHVPSGKDIPCDVKVSTACTDATPANRSVIESEQHGESSQNGHISESDAKVPESPGVSNPEQDNDACNGTSKDSLPKRVAMSSTDVNNPAVQAEAVDSISDGQNTALVRVDHRAADLPSSHTSGNETSANLQQNTDVVNKVVEGGKINSDAPSKPSSEEKDVAEASSSLPGHSSQQTKERSGRQASEQSPEPFAEQLSGPGQREPSHLQKGEGTCQSTQSISQQAPHDSTDHEPKPTTDQSEAQSSEKATGKVTAEAGEQEPERSITDDAEASEAARSLQPDNASAEHSSGNASDENIGQSSDAPVIGTAEQSPDEQPTAGDGSLADASGAQSDVEDDGNQSESQTGGGDTAAATPNDGVDSDAPDSTSAPGSEGKDLPIFELDPAESESKEWHKTFDIWNVFHQRNMLGQIVQYLSNFGADNYTPLLLDVILNQMEKTLSDEEVLRLLRKCDWIWDSPSLSVLEELGKNWSPKAWRLLACAQTGYYGAGTEHHLFWNCESLVAAIRERAAELANKGSDSDSETTHSSNHDEIFSLDWGKKVVDEEFVFTMSLRINSVVHPWEDLTPLCLRLRLLERSGHQISGETGKRTVNACVNFIESGCGCALDPPTSPAFGATASSSGGSLIRSDVMLFRDEGIYYRILDGYELKEWLRRHNNQCGLALHVRLYVAPGDEDKSDTASVHSSDDNQCTCGFCECEACDQGNYLGSQSEHIVDNENLSVHDESEGG